MYLRQAVCDVHVLLCLKENNNEDGLSEKQCI